MAGNFAHGDVLGRRSIRAAMTGFEAKSREDVARAILISAFLDDAVDTIENDYLAAMLRPLVATWMQVQDEVSHG